MKRACQSPNHPEMAPAKDPWACPRCGRWVCAMCEGGADDYPDYCDQCWAVMTKRVVTYPRETQ